MENQEISSYGHRNSEPPLFLSPSNYTPPASCRMPQQLWRNITCWLGGVPGTLVPFEVMNIHALCISSLKRSQQVCPYKMDGWKITFLLGRPIFRCYVSFREGIHYTFKKWNKIAPQNSLVKKITFLFRRRQIPSVLLLISFKKGELLFLLNYRNCCILNVQIIKPANSLWQCRFEEKRLGGCHLPIFCCSIIECSSLCLKHLSGNFRGS